MKPKLDLVIFGGTGDLSTRKLLPALFQLHRHQLADRLHRIIATGRATIATEDFRNTVKANQTFLPQGSWSEEVEHLPRPPGLYHYRRRQCHGLPRPGTFAR